MINSILKDVYRFELHQTKVWPKELPLKGEIILALDDDSHCEFGKLSTKNVISFNVRLKEDIEFDAVEIWPKASWSNKEWYMEGLYYLDGSTLIIRNTNDFSV